MNSFVDELIIEINPLIRPAVSSALDSVQQLLDEDEISFEIAKSIDGDNLYIRILL